MSGKGRIRTGLIIFTGLHLHNATCTLRETHLKGKILKQITEV